MSDIRSLNGKGIPTALLRLEGPPAPQIGRPSGLPPRFVPPNPPLRRPSPPPAPVGIPPIATAPRSITDSQRIIVKQRDAQEPPKAAPLAQFKQAAVYLPVAGAFTAVVVGGAQLGAKLAPYAQSLYAHKIHIFGASFAFLALLPRKGTQRRWYVSGAALGAAVDVALGSLLPSLISFPIALGLGALVGRAIGFWRQRRAE